MSISTQVPTITVSSIKNPNGEVFTINASDFDAKRWVRRDSEFERIRREQLAARFILVIEGAGYGEVAARGIFAEHFETYMQDTASFVKMLEDTEKEQKDRRENSEKVKAANFNAEAALKESASQAIANQVDERLTALATLPGGSAGDDNKDSGAGQGSDAPSTEGQSGSVGQYTQAAEEDERAKAITGDSPTHAAPFGAGGKVKVGTTASKPRR